MKIMGILNATPDSFSDGGALDAPGALDARISAWLDAGVDVFDVGGESTRPGFEAVSVEDEMARVLPVIAAIRDQDAQIPISIDTSKAVVARAALEAGATMVNDVSSLRDPAMGPLVADEGCQYVAMRSADCHGEIVAACNAQLQELVARCLSAGIKGSQIMLDPGLGFGKRPGANVADNLALVDRIADYANDMPVLIGASRKRFVGALDGTFEPDKRLAGSLAVATRAADAGAFMLRVHDVVETIEALAQR